MGSSNRTVAGWSMAILLFTAYAVFSAMHLSPWAAAWDEVDFVLALDRFDLLAMQPHAPGYPYFILGGRLFRPFFDNPAFALGAWNLLLTCSSAFPVYRLARRLLQPAAAALAATVVLTVPMNWALAVRPMSEGAALALLWWFLWSLARLSEQRSNARWLTASLLFGLLMGTRFSYVPFGAGLALIWAAAWLDPDLPVRCRIGRAVWRAGTAAGFQLLWIGAVAAAEGGLAGTLRLLAGFGEGHFAEWGGGVSPSSGLSFGRRLWMFAADNWFWSAAFARSAAAAVAAAVVLLFLIWRLWREKSLSFTGHGRLTKWMFSPWGILTVSTVAYALWALLGQNIEKPRHAAPLAALTMFALTAGALRTRTLPKAATLLVFMLAAVQTFEGARLVMLQHEQVPAVYQLAGRLAMEPGPSTVVYTWEEERVLRYLNVPVQTRPIFTYEYFQANIQAESKFRILLTGSVWEEFRRQVKLPASKVRRVSEFRSDPRLDPVYGNIVLYEWIWPPKGNL